MKQPCIRRGKIVKVHDGSLLHYVTLESGGRRRRFFCIALVWAVLNPQLSADVWLCHRGRRLIDMVPARGDRPSPMDRLLLLSSLANALQLPDTIDRALLAHGYGADVESLGHYAKIFMDDDGSPDPFADAETFSALKKDVERELRALTETGAREFACNYADAYALLIQKRDAGETGRRTPEWFKPFDEKYRALRPTLAEVLDEYVAAHEREIFAALPEAEIVQ